MKASVFLTLSICLSANVFADLFLGVPREEITETIEQCYHLNPKADELIEKMIEQYPESPPGYLIKTTRAFWQMEYAQTSGEFEEAFNEAANKAFLVAKKYRTDHPESLDAFYILGMTELSLARYYIERGKWLSAFGKARAGLGKIRKTLARDPDYHDAKFSLGLANCYLDKAPGYLKPFALLMRFSGNMEKGLQHLNDVKDKGFFAKYEAEYYLGIVHWELKDDPLKAQEYFVKLAERFPRNVEFHHLTALIDMRHENLVEALDRFDYVIDLPELDPYPKKRAQLLLQSAQTLQMMQDWEQGLERAILAEKACESVPRTNYLQQWTLLTQANSLRVLGRRDESIAKLESIEQAKNKRAYKRAQDILTRMREEEQKSLAN